MIFSQSVYVLTNGNIMRGAPAKRQFQIEMMNIDCVNSAGGRAAFRSSADLRRAEWVDGRYGPGECFGEPVNVGTRGAVRTAPLWTALRSRRFIGISI
jgi:hypothetical protein